MTRLDDSTRVRHMVAAAERARELVNGRRRQDLEIDDVLGLALVRLLEILGEAAGGVSEDVRAQNPEIPWRQIVGTRNRVIHAYFNVDMDIVWRIATEELDPIIRHLNELLQNEDMR